MPWYRSGAVVALSLVFCFPVGLALMWAGKLWSPGVRVGVTALFGVFLLMGMMKPRPNVPAQVANVAPTAEALQAPAPTRDTAERRPEPLRAPPAPTFIKESCLELSSKFGPSSKLSDLQKDELWPSYDGKAFEWKLEITDVSSRMLGGYSVQAKCSPKSPSLIQDVVLFYDSDAKQFVLGLEKGATYTLKGTLSHSTTLLGLGAKGMP